MPGILAAASVCGSSVFGADGDTVGSITELMIDADSGAIAYAVLSFGGVLGVGEKLFAVPWESFAIDPISNRIALNVSSEELEASTGFDKDAWPTEADPFFYSVAART